MRKEKYMARGGKREGAGRKQLYSVKKKGVSVPDIGLGVSDYELLVLYKETQDMKYIGLFIDRLLQVSSVKTSQSDVA